MKESSSEIWSDKKAYYMIINITKIQAISLYFDNTTALMSFLNPNL